MSEHSTISVLSRSPISSRYVEHAADLRVGVREVRGEALHEARAATFWSSGSSSSHAGTQCGRGVSSVPAGSRPLSSWPRERRLAPRVPAHVEVALVARDPFGVRVVRRVARAGREVAEERLLVVDRAQVGEELDRAVGEVGAQVVAVLVGARREHRVVVVVERRRELVRLAAVEPVPAVEAAAERPARARPGHVHLVFGREVPLADRVGRVAVRAQDLGQEAVLAGDHPPVAGKARPRGRRRGPCRCGGGCGR